MLALRRCSALRTVRASTHCTSSPCEVRNAAPSRVAINSPCAMHASAQALAHFADQRDARGDLSQTLELIFEIRAGDDAEVARQVAMALLDLLHDRLPLVAERETAGAARGDR